jgi:hypothetical protein
MNRFFNALLLFFLFPTMAVTIYVGFDLPIEFLKVSGSSLPYREEVFLALGLILIIINLRRSIRRWMGMHIVNQLKKFKWNAEVTKERKQRVVVYNLLEALVLGSVGFGLYTVTDHAWFPAIALGFCTVDNILFTLVGIFGKKYRAGVTGKAVIFADRDVQLLYFSGLRKVSIHQQSIYFDYIKGLQMDIPLDSIPEDQLPAFFEAIESNIDRDKVFFSHTK